MHAQDENNGLFGRMYSRGGGKRVFCERTVLLFCPNFIPKPESVAIATCVAVTAKVVSRPKAKARETDTHRAAQTKFAAYFP